MTTREKIEAAIHSWIYRDGTQVLIDEIMRIVEAETVALTPPWLLAENVRLTEEVERLQKDIAARCDCRFDGGVAVSECRYHRSIRCVCDRHGEPTGETWENLARKREVHLREKEAEVERLRNLTPPWLLAENVRLTEEAERLKFQLARTAEKPNKLSDQALSPAAAQQMDRVLAEPSKSSIVPQDMPEQAKPDDVIRVGDTVECISGTTLLEAGSRYTVSSSINGTVSLAEFDDQHAWNSSRFRKVQPASETIRKPAQFPLVRTICGEHETLVDKSRLAELEAAEADAKRWRACKERKQFPMHAEPGWWYFPIEGFKDTPEAAVDAAMKGGV